MGEGWVLVLVALISAGAGLVPSLLSRREKREARLEESRREHLSAKRSAYENLVRVMQQVRRATEEALDGKGPDGIPLDLIRQAVEAEAVASIYASPIAWKDIGPGAKSTYLLAVSLTGGPRAKVAWESLQELVGEDAWTKAQEAHDRTLTAIRLDIAPL